MLETHDATQKSRLYFKCLSTLHYSSKINNIYLFVIIAIFSFTSVLFFFPLLNNSKQVANCLTASTCKTAEIKLRIKYFDWTQQRKKQYCSIKCEGEKLHKEIQHLGFQKCYCLGKKHYLSLSVCSTNTFQVLTLFMLSVQKIGRHLHFHK